MIFRFAILFTAISQGLILIDESDGFGEAHLEAPIFNHRIGRQEFDFVSGPLVSTNNQNIFLLSPAELDAFARNKVVLIDDNNLWDFGVIVQQLESLRDAGALAVIKLGHYFPTAGIMARMDAPLTSDPDSSIPLIHIVVRDLTDDIRDRIKRGTIIANVSADHNDWEDEVWGTMSFFVMWRVLLPLINYAGVLLALTACATLAIHQRYTQAQRSKMNHAKRQMRTSNMRLLMFGNGVICMTCAFRQFYCFEGPVFSSHNMQFHFVLFDHLVVWEAVTSAVAILIFRNWASFGMPQNQRKIDTFLRRLVLFVTVPIYLIISTYDGIRQPCSVTASVRLICLFILSSIGSGVSIYRVTQFLRHSSKLQGSPTAATGHRRRIGFFMSIACVMGVIVDLSRLATYIPAIRDGPVATFILLTVVFLGLSIQGIAQVIAFFPSVAVVRHGGRIVHKGCEVAQELRQRRHFALKSSNDSRPANMEFGEFGEFEMQDGVMLDIETCDDASPASVRHHPSNSTTATDLTEMEQRSGETGSFGQEDLAPIPEAVAHESGSFARDISASWT